MTALQVGISLWCFWIAAELIAFYWLLKNDRK